MPSLKVAEVSNTVFILVLTQSALDVRMVLFGTSASIFADLNLIAQIVLLTLLVLGIVKRKPLQIHGKVMMSATVVNIVATLLFMAPSLLLNWGSFTALPFPPGPAIVVVHGIVGTLAILLGALWTYRFIVATRRSAPLACGKKKMMWLTAGLWLYATGGGIVFYILLYL
ncbi:MAG: hypothetical protein HXY34_10930 [Candidatus Thorarchaeota archaeon]|nr:hypothetical protein [Candidatus Thorarchaeota archaeon]